MIDWQLKGKLTTEGAIALYDLLDDLQRQIYIHYQEDIEAFLWEQGRYECRSDDQQPAADEFDDEIGF